MEVEVEAKRILQAVPAHPAGGLFERAQAEEVRGEVMVHSFEATEERREGLGEVREVLKVLKVEKVGAEEEGLALVVQILERMPVEVLVQAEVLE